MNKKFFGNYILLGIGASLFALCFSPFLAFAMSSGYLDSQTFDTGVSGGVQLNSVLWHGVLPVGTAVGFQFAVSNTSSGVWSFIGPNGVANSTSSYWNALTPSSSVSLDYNLYNNFRYFRYRITLFSDAAQW